MQDIVIHCKYDKLIPIETFIPHDKNANKHPQEQIDLLAKLIKFQGVRHPVIISKLSGKCVAGHGRYEAMKQLGFEFIPADFQDFEDTHQELAFLVSDNKIQELAETDYQILEQIKLEMPQKFNLELLGIPDILTTADEIKNTSAELEIASFDNFQHQCPKCSFEWNDNGTT